VDGEAKLSCTLSVEEVVSRSVTTIEGLGGPVGRALKQAWVKEDVPQCGYCQPGQLMTATALLKEILDPTDVEIEEAMSGVLCRCGTYEEIRKAIHLAAAEVHHGKE
jgi:isoquinoline 1-oxidoreductase alpha subunit